MWLRSLYLVLSLIAVINESLKASMLLFFQEASHVSRTQLSMLFFVYMATKQNFVIIRHKCTAFITGNCGNNTQKLRIFKKNRPNF